MTDLLQLAERVEQASGPNRALDAAIHVALFIPSERAGRIDVDELRGVVGWHPIDGPYQSAVDAKRFTSSIDAAMTLVPEGWERIQQEQARVSDGSVRCWATVDNWPASPRRCATPALALCAAALRARAASNTGETR